jgi:methionyl aminopeptidase
VRGRERIQYKTAEQIKLMRRAGLVVADALDAVRAALQPGVTTKQLDAVAEDVIRSAGATPSFLGYQGYPASLCISVNEEIVHGIPGARVIAAGDVVSIDGGAILAGWHGDAAFTLIVPPAQAAVEDRDAELVEDRDAELVEDRDAELVEDRDAELVEDRDAELVEVTRQSMWAGIAAMVEGERLNAVGAAVEDHVGDRFGIVEGYGGHGIGTAMHQDPHVLNYRTRDRGPRMKAGLCLAIEPMLTAGDPRTKVLADDWTVVTKDGSRAAHWEHSIALTDGGPWVLTARDGGVAELAALGVRARPLAD